MTLVWVAIDSSIQPPGRFVIALESSRLAGWLAGGMAGCTLPEHVCSEAVAEVDGCECTEYKQVSAQKYVEAGVNSSVPHYLRKPMIA